jgi:transketolase
LSKEKLGVVANKIRQFLIISLTSAGSGHTAGSLGLADIFTYLYFSYLKINTKDPFNEKRDRFYLSNGHVCPVWYTTLALRGFFDVKKLSTLRDIKSKLQGHPHYRMLPGVENSSGPLGQGISQAVGAAIALRKAESKVVCLISDGELQEGQTWEALMKIGNERLQNLTIIVDRNDIQISGFTSEVMPVEPLIEKLESFNLVVFEIDGNNLKEIEEAFMKRDLIDKPVVIIANTIPGKGVSFIEGDYLWHGKVPNKEEAKEAIKELKAL